MAKTQRAAALAVIAAAVGGAGAGGADAASPGGEANTVEHPEFADAEVAFFRDEVRPILEANCFGCHGGEDDRGRVKVRSGLQLISRLGILLGGDHGPAFDAADPGASLILRMVSYSDGDHQMPPRGKLADGDIGTLRRWVELGMPWTPGDVDRLAEVEGEGGASLVDRAATHWAYQPLSRPEVPEVDGLGADANPIDAFVGARLAVAGIEPNPAAPRGELARRAYFDLTGLPPSPAEIEAFASGGDPADWGRLVEDLLARPQYGERWGRHWLDVVRFAESNGFERDSEKRAIWRYRDYVIDAFNADKPYDEFVMEQLAGDELDTVTGESMVATGYHRLMQWDDEPADPLQHKYDVLDDNVRTTGEAFLGLTIGCARCHDHKADPVSQEDYFSFMAFFHGITPMGKESVLEEIELAVEPGDEAEVARRAAAAESRIAMLEQRIERAHERVFEAAGIDPQGKPLIPSGRRSGREWNFTNTDPGEGWNAVGFRPGSSWESGIGRRGNGAGATGWDGGDLWLHTTFRLTDIPEAAHFTVAHRGAVGVYLNGELVVDATAPRGGTRGDRTTPLGPGAIGVLQTGRNTVAVRCWPAEGSRQLVDVGLYASPEIPDPAALIAERGDELLGEGGVESYLGLVEELERLAEGGNGGRATAMVVREAGVSPPQLHVHIRGSAGAQGAPVEPRFPEVFGGGGADPITPPADRRSSGRRRALAEWITAPDNPRTARVMVNRIWQHHFGRGLCPSPNDFGMLGEPATHPELLDWLATEFVRRGWSVKSMHRLIMSSQAYRRSSRGRPGALAADPQNDLLWRFDMRRLSAEEIRDTMLAVSGELNLEQGGPGVYVPLPDAVLATSSKGAGMWGRASAADAARRSVYVKVKRSLKPPEFTGFDFADTDSSCPVRFTTTVPTQALDMLNGEFTNERATAFAQRLRGDHPGDRHAQVRAALELALSRPPAEAEVDHCLTYYESVARQHPGLPDLPLERVCLLILNLNEFIYLD